MKVLYDILRVLSAEECLVDRWNSFLSNGSKRAIIVHYGKLMDFLDPEEKKSRAGMLCLSGQGNPILHSGKSGIGFAFAVEWAADTGIVIGTAKFPRESWNGSLVRLNV